MTRLASNIVGATPIATLTILVQPNQEHPPMSAQENVQAVEEKIASQGAPVAEEAPVTPSPAQPSGEVEKTDELGEAASPEGAEARKANKKSASDRISELYRKTKDSERDAEAARAEKEYWRLKALELQTASQPAEKTQKTLEDFAWDQDKYLDYKAEIKAREALDRMSTEQRQQAERAKIQEREQSFHERIQKFEDTHPDIDFIEDVIKAPIAISDTMADFIKESDIGPEMAVYFKDHATEAKSIFDMVPTQAARALAKLEVRLSAPLAAIPEQPAQITRAPPAPPRLNASSVGRSASEGVQAEIAAVRAKNHR